jgi:hypothetical protein
LEALAVNLTREEQEIVRQLGLWTGIDLATVVQVFDACGRD